MDSVKRERDACLKFLRKHAAELKQLSEEQPIMSAYRTRLFGGYTTLEDIASLIERGDHRAEVA